MDAQWLKWTQHNLARGCDPSELARILAGHGFSLDQVACALAGAGNAPTMAGIDYQALANPPLLRNLDALGGRAVTDDRLQLYEIPDFLDAETCADIVELMDVWLRPSTVTTGNLHYGFRTSQTCDLGQLQDARVAALDAEIGHALGLNLAWAEATQGQKYEVGQEFKAHTDYFQPNTPEYAQFAGARGQRSWTFMIYLNATDAGGATHFTHLNRSFFPRPGTALVWNNLQADGSPNPVTQHQGMPVEAGTKFIVTKWFRDRGPSPMFVPPASDRRG